MNNILFQIIVSSGWNFIIKRVITCGILLFSLNGIILSQQTIAASGGTGSSTGGSVSYTVGQVVCNVVLGSGGSSLQGVQVPYEIYVLSSTEEGDAVQLTCKVFPNPVVEKLFLLINGNNTSDMKYLLYDMNGRLLRKEDIRQNEVILPFNAYKSGVYVLRIMMKDSEIKTYKIVKH